MKTELIIAIASLIRLTAVIGSGICLGVGLNNVWIGFGVSAIVYALRPYAPSPDC